ncbi:hypothetical protein AWC11_07680 [Mycobacterium interjectum]|nr:hypothetical protein AWC11_07680 [Mycobacterium interjectum]
MLFARVLVQIATSETIAAAAAAGHLPEYIKLYTGDDHGEEPRLRALSRAVGLYDRAIAWLRRLGVAGEVRNIAIAEREKALSLLDIRLQNANLRFNHELEFHEIEKRVAELRKMLNTMIVEGILRAELNSWSQVQDRETRRAAAAMMSALDDSWRYLKKPELGLRTDLPPTIESISG